MADLIALIIFIISLGGILFIIAGKLPVLAQLPQNGVAGIKEHRIFCEIEHKLKDISLAFKKQILLHKMLSWAKIVLLKIETKVDHLLGSLRKKAKEQKENQDKNKPS